MALTAAAFLPACTPRRQASAPAPARSSPARTATTQNLNQVSGVIRAEPKPCASHPGDVVGLLLEGTGAPRGTVVVFGQAFRAGDVPRGAGLLARLATTGEPLPVQLDVTTRNPDGSARFGLVSLATPALREAEKIGVVLSVQPERQAGATPLELAAAGRSAVLVLEPLGPGQPWRADLLALLRQGRDQSNWQAGPLAVQQRVTASVPPSAVGGATSLRLVADIALRADGTLWVDAWLRNDIAMRPGGGDARYRMRLLLDEREALAAELERHWQYSGWGRQAGAAAGGQPAPEPPFVHHDAAYLADAGAVMAYDLSTGVWTGRLLQMQRDLEKPDWDTPLNPRGIETRMGAPGARPDLGMTTLWNATWLMTGDRRAARFCIGQAEAAGSVPWFYWDPAGGAGGRGGWLDVRRWPRFWTSPRNGPAPRSPLQPAPGDTVWANSPVTSHQPNVSFVPFLLTGRRAFLDNLLAQAAWNVIGVWPGGPRQGPPDAGPMRDILLVWGRQIREIAWAMRELNQSAWIVPDNDPNRPYIQSVEAANWAWLRSRTPELTARQGELHGYVDSYSMGRYHLGVGPWQQDYLATSVALAAQRGNEDARAVLVWMSNFIVGRFMAGDKGFEPQNGVSSYFAVYRGPPVLPPGSPPAQPITTWAEAGALTREWNRSDSRVWRTEAEYSRLALLSLAMVANVLDSEDARRAYAWLANAGAPYTARQNFEGTPYHNVTPRGVSRSPAQAVRCVRPAPPQNA